MAIACVPEYIDEDFVDAALDVVFNFGVSFDLHEVCLTEE